MKSTFFFILIMIIFLTGCEKPYIPCDPSNPDCIYAVCRVDGERWGMSCERDGIFGCSAADVQYYRNDGTNNLYIYVKNESDDRSVVALYIANAFEKNINFNLDYTQKGPTFFALHSQSVVCDVSRIDTTQYNKFTLHEIDTINRIMAGEFEFTGQDTCGKVVHITDGRFRLNYRF